MIRTLAKAVAPIAALAMGAALSGCAYMADWEEVEGVPLAELDMSGDPPTRITLAGPDKVVITEGDTLEITLDGDADAGAALRFNRDGERLTIARDNKVYDGRGSAIVRMSIPAPSDLSIAGSGTIEAFSMAGDADVEIAGSGDITVASIEAEELEVDIAGSGNVTAVGTAARLSVEIAGSGNVRLEELTADDVTIEIAGSGNVQVASNGKVDAEIAGSGDIIVTGSATCSVQSAGAGSLTCRPAATTAAVDPDEAGSGEGGDEATEEAAAE